MARNSPDVLVVGGGLIGCSIARELAREGMSVTVLERGTVGSGASQDAAGMLAPQAEADEPGPFLDLCIESAHLFPALAEQLFDEVAGEIRYRTDGSFLVAFDDEEAERLRATAEKQRAIGLTAEIVDADAARRAEPAIARDVVAVLSIPDDHQVDNRRLTQAVADSCRARGVRIAEGVDVTALVRDSAGRTTGVVANGETIAAGLTIVAAGCWSALIEGFPVPVEPVKGQMLALDLAAPPFARILRSERCYLVSRIDGRVLVGATMERVGFDQAVSAQVVGTMLEAARQIAPSLTAALGGEAWAGLRPATPDGLPAIGRVDDGLIAATGHFRNGILLSPVTAAIVSDIVLGREPHPALGILDPLRFERAPATHPE